MAKYIQHLTEEAFNGGKQKIRKAMSILVNQTAPRHISGLTLLGFILCPIKLLLISGSISANAIQKFPVMV